MAAHFQLWDTVTGNLIATYPSETEALSLVRRVIDGGERALVEGWALGYEDRRGRGRQIAAGADLAERALRMIPA